MSVPSTALLACPHCGHPAMIEELHPTLPNGEKDTLYRVRCTLRECQSSTLDWYPAAAAVTAWNRRANIALSVTNPAGHLPLDTPG